MEEEIQLDLFGGAPTIHRRNPVRPETLKEKQLSLFDGINCLPGQMNLFAGAGVPEDMVAAGGAADVGDDEPEE
jgi:hypothetical protein